MTISTYYDIARNRLNLAFNRYDGDFGIEIETESLKDYALNRMTYWTVHGDGSLRNVGKEFVLKQPVLYEQVDDVLNEFKTATKDVKFIENANNTSVHAHMNMLNDNIMTMGNVMTLYAMFEKPLINFSGENRTSNLFCLGMDDSEAIVNMTTQLVKGFRSDFKRGVGPNHIQEDQFKYGAMNLSALGKYGTLEFRSFRGTTNTDEIKEWLTALHRIKLYARNKVTPQELVVRWDKQKEKMFDDVFGDLSKKLKTKDLVSTIERKGFEHAARIAYSIDDWEHFIKEKDDILMTNANLDVLSKALYGKLFGNMGSEHQQNMLSNFQNLWKNYVGTGDKSSKKKPKPGDILNVAEEGAIPGGINWDDIVPPAADAPQPWQIRNGRLANVRPGGVVNPAGEVPVVDEEFQRIRERQVAANRMEEILRQEREREARR